MQNKNIWIGLGVLVAIVLAASYLLYGKGGTYTPTYPTQQTTKATANPSGPVKNITIDAKEFSYTPSKISVNKGDNVSITFTNSGTLSHNLTIPDLNLATNTISPGTTDTLNFTADKVGTFTFYCSVDSHKDRGLIGTLEVK